MSLSRRTPLRSISARKEPCSIAYCGKPRHGLTLCSMHYRRLRVTGDTSTTKPAHRLVAVPDASDVERTERTRSHTLYFTVDGRVFILMPYTCRGKRAVRRVYGERGECETCSGPFLRRRLAQRFCSRGCDKMGERNPARRLARARKGIGRSTADKWFSRIVRSRGSCERCGESSPSVLQCAHIFSRRYLATRWAEDNALCLCASCHLFFTHRPIEWEDFIVGRIGSAAYLALRARAMAITKPDYGALLDVLLSRLGQLGLAA